MPKDFAGSFELELMRGAVRRRSYAGKFLRCRLAGKEEVVGIDRWLQLADAAQDFVWELTDGPRKHPLLAN